MCDPASVADSGATKVVVIGGGIAGVSVAYHLLQKDPDLDVILLEMEAMLAHHTTGRSAALLLENLGTPSMRVLSSASLDHLRHTPDDLVDAPLLAHRPVLHVGTVEQDASVDQMMAEGIGSATTPTVEVGVDEAMRLFPPLRRERVHRALVEPDSADIESAPSTSRSFGDFDGPVVGSPRRLGWMLRPPMGRAGVSTPRTGQWAPT